MMDKRIFLSTWKEIPAQNEVQYTIDNIVLSTGNWLLSLVSFHCPICDILNVQLLIYASAQNSD